MNKGRIIPSYQSPIRTLVSGAKGLNYRPLKSLEEAKKYSDAYLVMEGDSGGQIYIVVPVNLIRCSEDKLLELLHEIDKIEWPGSVVENCGIYYERMEKGAGVVGGMGGGLATDTLWLHKDIKKLRNKIEEVLDNNVSTIHLA